VRRIASALLVDDDDAFRTTLQGSLRRRGGDRTAATGGEGMIVLEEEACDRVVVDYRMPRGDGLGALAKYRRARPEAVIVMLTGFGDIALAIAAVKEGADTLMGKPVDADRLLREAEEIRARPRAGTHLPVPQNSFNLEEMERETIKAALSQCGGVVASAAKLLGIDRRTLQRKLKRIS